MAGETYFKRHSWALLTDLYQLTMAGGYWRAGVARREAVFQLAFREHPFDGQFSIACGLSDAIQALTELRFSRDDLDYLASLEGSDGRPLFDSDFLAVLAAMAFQCDVDAIPEGTVVFPQEPLVRVKGPLWQCQLVETLLLNIVNFQTLIATKAARICLAAEGEPVLEFGLRRAQGIDGGVSASRAAFVGGCQATSNVLAGKLFEIPVRGTHAHSWVMAFEDEQTAFDKYADAFPNNCIFLVDTYDTLAGVRRAARVGRRLRAAGHQLLGIRLDSGDLASLSREAREILNAEGFSDAAVVASGDLDEHSIAALKAAGARIDVWGVGTRLATAYDQPALGGVYKLSAIREPKSGGWSPRVKLSEQAIKSSLPGILQVRRFRDADRFLGDLLYDEAAGATVGPASGRLADGQDWLVPAVEHEDLLVPVFRAGKPVYEAPSPREARERARRQLTALPADVKLLRDAHPYSVGMHSDLFSLKERLAAEARGANS